MKYIICPHDNIFCTVCITNNLAVNLLLWLFYKTEQVLNIIQEEGFKILMQRQIVLTEEEAKTLCKEYENEDYFEDLIQNMTR